MMYYADGDLGYITKRLSDSIVNTNKGIPVYIAAIDVAERGVVCDSYTLRAGENMRLDLKDIDLTPVKLGWVNMGPDSFYLVRKPIRNVWKQGTCNENTAILGGGDKFPIRCTQVHDTIVGNYPTLKEALLKTSPKGKYKKVAFSRLFAVGGDQLFYKGNNVGTFLAEPRLNPPYIHLAEILHETLIQEAKR